MPRKTCYPKPSWLTLINISMPLHTILVFWIPETDRKYKRPFRHASRPPAAAVQARGGVRRRGVPVRVPRDDRLGKLGGKRHLLLAPSWSLTVVSLPGRQSKGLAGRIICRRPHATDAAVARLTVAGRCGPCPIQCVDRLHRPGVTLKHAEIHALDE